jgi:hypothetical protein
MIGCLGLLLPALGANGAPPESAGSGQTPAAADPAKALADARFRAEAALVRTDLAAYRGWIKFLIFEADTAGRIHSPPWKAAGARHHRAIPCCHPLSGSHCAGGCAAPPAAR